MSHFILQEAAIYSNRKSLKDYEQKVAGRDFSFYEGVMVQK